MLYRKHNLLYTSKLLYTISVVYQYLLAPLPSNKWLLLCLYFRSLILRSYASVVKSHLTPHPPIPMGTELYGSISQCLTEPEWPLPGKQTSQQSFVLTPFSM